MVAVPRVHPPDELLLLQFGNAVSGQSLEAMVGIDQVAAHVERQHHFLPAIRQKTKPLFGRVQRPFRLSAGMLMPPVEYPSQNTEEQPPEAARGSGTQADPAG